MKLFVLICTFMLLLSTCAENKKNIKTEPSPQLDWAKGMVWYQIFPERFRNGDPANDPTVGEVPYAERQPGWQPHPWTSDWYALQPWEKRYSEKFYKCVYQRRYGGDLIGVIEKLDYLKALGVDGIYFNPVFEAQSLHKYDGASFHHIDDNFGPDPAGDKARLAAAAETENPDTWVWTSADSTFLKLLEEAHRRNIKIVIDGVFNHTGRAFFAFKDILEKQQASRYSRWYDIESWDDPATGANEFAYKGWWGAWSLPEFAENERGIVSGPREYIFAATRRWMDPNGDGDPTDGIDGWRLDVAPEVAIPFWQEWNALVKSINPKAITVAEIWEDASDWIEKDCFDGAMNYLFAKAVVDFFIDQDTAIPARAFAERLHEVEDIYGKETQQLLWNLLDSHDTDRLPSMMLNPDRNYDRNGSPRDNPGYLVRKPNEAERQIQKQIAAFQMTYAGAPMIYYGTEAGMWGADDPDDRKPMLWTDLQFDNEKSHPIPGKTRPNDPNFFDEQLFEFYKKLIRIRHEHKALHSGETIILDAIIRDDLFAFSRHKADEQVIALFNRSGTDAPVTLTDPYLKGSQYQDLMDGKSINVETDKLLLNVPAKGFKIVSKID